MAVLASTVVDAFLDAAPDAMIGVGVDGRVRWINTQAEVLFEYQREELIGQSVDLLVPETSRSVHAANRARYVNDPRPRSMGAGLELAGRRKDGSEFPAEISLSAIETDDGLVAVAAVRDVTDRLSAQAEHERLRAEAQRERLEVRMQQSQRLESLGQLAGGVAHDFNNLLGVIVNYAAFVNEELAAAAAEGSDESARWEPVRADVDQITKAADRATLLTRQLLAFARREVVRPEVLNLNDVIGEVEQLLERALGEHVELSTSLDPDLWPVLVDPGKVEQVLVNLAVNARDAMPSGGTLTIDTQNVVADGAYAAPPRYRRGPPCPPPCERHRMRHGRGSPRRARSSPSTRQRVPARARVSGSPPCTGSSRRPAATCRSTPNRRPGRPSACCSRRPSRRQWRSTWRWSQHPAAAAGEIVLVVEDEGPLRAVTCRVLTRHGYEVLSAANGLEALEVARATDRIDLLLTDVIMPHMLGKELASRLQELRPHLPVVFMSGYVQPVLASSGRLDPGIVLVEKPFTADGLLEKVRAALDAAGPSALEHPTTGSAP